MAATPAGFAEVQRAERGRAIGMLLAFRLFLFPTVVALALWHWRATGASTGQLLLLCGFFALVVAHLAFLFRQRKRGVQTQTLGLSGALIALGVCFLTGGLDSPFIIILPVIATMTAMGGPRRLEGWSAAAAQVVALPLLALGGATRPWFSAGMILFGLGVGVFLGFTIRAMFDRMLARALQAHEDVLRTHSEQLQALTTLSGEIAHELKTPLASINGLTGLALLELDDPTRAAERLHVLGGEAARMQRLLDEFLNFSRPLSPLSLDTVDGMRLGEEAVDLFQGLVHERRLSIVLSGGRVELHCDPRKIKQLLINLVQNAVEASVPGGEVRIEVEPGSRDAAIRVLDRGEGLAATVAPRVFEPGVTTKARGSGLGLTIARSIAEQHGGSLSLRQRQGGGCVAELVLPRAPPRPGPEGRAA
jgi:signal transduction histidine kinase